MRKSCDKRDGYRETIEKGLLAAKALGRNIFYAKSSGAEQINRLKNEIKNADTLVIGAGAGLSTSAGLIC